MNTNQMHSSSNSMGRSSSTWFKEFKRRGFYFQYAAITTILMGLYLHISRVFLGDDLLIRYIFTPLFDRVLTIPMLYSGLTGLLIWSRIDFRSPRHKFACGLALFYIAGSVPLHIWNVYLHDTTEYIRWFPLWFTFLLFPIYVGIITLVWRLRFKENSK